MGSFINNTFCDSKQAANAAIAEKNIYRGAHMTNLLNFAYIIISGYYLTKADHANGCKHWLQCKELL